MPLVDSMCVHASMSEGFQAHLTPKLILGGEVVFSLPYSVMYVIVLHVMHGMTTVRYTTQFHIGNNPGFTSVS